MREPVAMLISGILVMGYAVAAMFFLQFWKQTTDRLFLLFSAAFALLAVQRVWLALSAGDEAWTVWLYALRLLAFLIILVAIADKNRVRPDR